MKPEIGVKPFRYDLYVVTVDGKMIGSAMARSTADVVAHWLYDCWPELETVTLANHHAGMQQRATPSSVRKIEAETKHVAKVLVDAKKRKVRK